MVGEPLANDALQQPVGTITIITAKRDAVAVAEIKLGKVAVKMLLAAPLIDAFHAALEDAEIAFDGVAVDAAASILARAAGANSIQGNGAANTLNGGLGNDTLRGGSGSDRFLFDSTLNASSNVDRLADFSVVNDTIQLDDDVFAAIGATGTLSAGAFRTGTAASDADDRIIYDSATGRIYYDADGNGAGAQILFARVTAGLSLTNSDFQIVG